MEKARAKRQRPGDDFGKLRRRAGEVLARTNADGSDPVPELREVDREDGRWCSPR